MKAHFRHLVLWWTAAFSLKNGKSVYGHESRSGGIGFGDRRNGWQGRRYRWSSEVASSVSRTRVHKSILGLGGTRVRVTVALFVFPLMRVQLTTGMKDMTAPCFTVEK